MQQSPIKLTPLLFTELDTDVSGTISAAEVSNLCILPVRHQTETFLQLRVALDKQGDADAVDSIMNRADVNGDGEISYDEYYRLMNMDKFGDAAVSPSFVTGLIIFRI